MFRKLDLFLSSGERGGRNLQMRSSDWAQLSFYETQQSMCLPTLTLDQKEIQYSSIKNF
jgi:hypothetical protein